MFRKKNSKIALHALILATNPHVGAADSWIRRLLEHQSHVRHIHSDYGFSDSVFRMIRRNGINTIFLAVHEYFYTYDHDEQKQFAHTCDFIEKVRQLYPAAIFVLAFPSSDYRDKFLAHHLGRFNHYLYVLPECSTHEFAQVLEKCEIWH